MTTSGKKVIVMTDTDVPESINVYCPNRRRGR